MPITPLHFGLMAPIRHAAPRKVSSYSFILANIWIDQYAITAWLSGEPLPGHAELGHSFVGAALTFVLIGMLGVRSMPWALGALLGAFSHVLLDSLVHADMNPFWPREGNPLYMGWMEPLSWVLVPMSVWFIALYVLGILGWVRKRLAAWKARNPKPSA